MAFTNNRIDFRNQEGYGEGSNGSAFNKGVVSFVTSGLDLVNNDTLTNGTFICGGAFGQLGLAGETHQITPSYTGFVVIRAKFTGDFNGSAVVELSSTRKDTDPLDTSKERYFTIYELDNGLIKKDSDGVEVGDLRHNNYIKQNEFVQTGENEFVHVLNGVVSNKFSTVFAGDQRVITPYEANYDNGAMQGLSLDEQIQHLIDVNLGSTATKTLNIEGVMGISDWFSFYEACDEYGLRITEAPISIFLNMGTTFGDNIPYGGKVSFIEGTIDPNRIVRDYIIHVNGGATRPYQKGDLLSIQKINQSIFTTKKVQGDTFTVPNWREYEKLTFRLQYTDATSTGGLFLDVFLNPNDGNQYGDMANRGDTPSPDLRNWELKLTVSGDTFTIADTQLFTLNTSGTVTTQEFALVSCEALGTNNRGITTATKDFEKPQIEEK